jgi:hypothetical protein
MTFPPLEFPLLRAAAWFGAEPPEELRAQGPDGFLDLTWGPPELGFVEPLQRRRLSRLARACFHCAGRVSPPGDVRMVFASRHGEAGRTLAILRDLAAGNEVSPTQFSMSVHNAVAGLWSILRGDRASVCAVAAGPESFGWGLVEALAEYRADPGSPVLYVYGEDLLPEPWAGPVPAGLLHAAALLVGEPAGRRLGLTLAPGGTGQDGAEPEGLQSLHCLASLGRPQAPWAGPGGSWDWHLT